VVEACGGSAAAWARLAGRNIDNKSNSGALNNKQLLQAKPVVGQRRAQCPSRNIAKYG